MLLYFFFFSSLIIEFIDELPILNCIFQVGFFIFFFLSKIEIREVLYKHMYKKNEHISFSFYMPTITSYFGFLLSVLIITSSLFIGLSKIRLIWFVILRGIVIFGIIHSRIRYYVNLQFSIVEIYDQYRFMFKAIYYLSFYFSNK